jgi:hypothetical protein
MAESRHSDRHLPEEPRAPMTELVLVDPERSHGQIIVELYPFLVTASDRPHFELSPSDAIWYSHFRQQFEAIWESAKEYERKIN